MLSVFVVVFRICRLYFTSPISMRSQTLTRTLTDARHQHQHLHVTQLLTPPVTGHITHQHDLLQVK